MTKRLLLASAAVFAFSGGAFAADLPTRVEAPAPFIAPPVFTWTGFYAGVNAGVGFNAGDDRDSTVTVLPSGFSAVPGGAPVGFTRGSILYGDNSEDAAFTGGAQIGYNYQFVNNFVLGAEADIQFLGFDDDTTAAITTTGFPAGFTPARRGTEGIDWFGTVRLRAGYAFDRTLVYATGGLAYGEGDATRYESVTTGRVFFDDSDVSFGWTLGAGVEYAWTNNLIIGLEGLYVSLDRDTNITNFAGTYDPPPAGGVNYAISAADDTQDDNIEFGVVRARLSYKF
ncbi:outer membrane beta-barrel protein [Salinarimonas sp.]|uniref:outer membrane protein n=1 Tax=Salinarimonas sp. TaxID=2766526 RepID=UPI0032D8E2C9